MPFKFESSIFMEMDFELPGFPIMRMGILFIKHMRVAKRFSIKAALYAIF